MNMLIVGNYMLEQQDLTTVVAACLSAANAEDVVVLDTRKLMVIADAMIVCTGNTSRHLDAIATQVRKRCKAFSSKIGVEHDNNWVLIDLQSVVVHIMLPEARDLYKLEQLWSVPAKES